MTAVEVGATAVILHLLLLRNIFKPVSIGYFMTARRAVCGAGLIFRDRGSTSPSPHQREGLTRP
jgi:hypothetical protein